MGKRNWLRLHRDAEAFCKATGRKLNVPRDLDPDTGMALLLHRLNALSRHVELYENDAEPENGEYRFRLFQVCVLTNGNQGYYIPLRKTYEGMSPAFGLLVRRFVRSFLDYGGILNADYPPYEMVRDYMDWEFECYVDGNESTKEEQKRIADYIESYYSGEEGTIGARLEEFYALAPLTEEELRAYIPTPEEKPVHDLMLSGAKYLSGKGVCLPLFSQYEEDNIIDDDYVEACEYIPLEIMFGVLWSDNDDDFIWNTIRDYCNDCLNNGGEHALLENVEVGEDGPMDAESHPVNVYLDFLASLGNAIS